MLQCLAGVDRGAPHWVGSPVEGIWDRGLDMNIAILGASRGLGLVLTETLLAAGHAVFAGVRREVPPALRSLEQRYQHLQTALVDVTVEAEMAAAAEDCRRRMGQLDVVYYVAGVIMPEDRVKLLHQLAMADIRETFEVSFFGAISAIQHFYPLVRKNSSNSAFMLITSESCDIDAAGSWIPAYALAKCAETKIARIMNESVSDVPFYALHPGRMNTDMGRETQQIEPEETARGLLELLQQGTLQKGKAWYVDYLGRPML